MLTTLPILIPMLAAAVCVAAWGRAKLQAGIALVSTASVLVCAILLLIDVESEGVRAVALSGWAAPFGIVLVADHLAAVMVLLTAIVGFGVAVYSIGSVDERRAANGHAPLVLAMLSAVAGAFLTGDLFNLYVWFELMLLSSFVLLTLGGERAQIEGAIKYVTLNLLSSVLFLSSVGLIYAVTGTLNMADLANRLDALDDPRLATALGTPLLIAFGIKAAVFPVFFWLPASYHTPPPVVSALFAGLLTKVGVYSIIRATTLIFDQELALLADSVLIVAGLTMVSGVLGAVAQNDMRRILSFHIVSQIGYMLMGLGVALQVVARSDDPAAAAPTAALIAMTGAVFYILHHIVVKTNLFLIAGAVIKLRGTSELAKLGGLAKTNPFLAGLFLISALSLAGIPVLSGFWAKLTLVRGGLEAESYPIVATSLVVSIFTLLSMTKIWSEAFWREAPTDVSTTNRVPIPMMLPIVAMTLVTLAIGAGAAPIYDLAERTAASLLETDPYTDAVLLPTEGESSP